MGISHDCLGQGLRLHGVLPARHVVAGGKTPCVIRRLVAFCLADDPLVGKTHVLATCDGREMKRAVGTR